MKKSAVMRIFGSGLLLIAAGVFAQEGGPEISQRQKIKKEEVPQPVLQAIQKDHPQLGGVVFERETREGNPIYGMEIRNKAQGKESSKEEEVLYSADGHLIERHTQTQVKSVPKNVVQSLKQSHPKATITEAEQVTDSSQSVIGYELDVRDGKKRMELVFNTEGKLLRQENI